MTFAELLAVLAAIPLAAAGGAVFLKGVIGVAALFQLPRMLVATTLAAFATSSPELAVSSLAALSGKPEIGLGDALGSNVVNLGLILGIALLFGPLAVRFDEWKRDFSFALFVPVLTLGLALDGTLSRLDGLALLVLLALWFVLIVKAAGAHRQHQVEELRPQSVNASRVWLQLLLGLAALVGSGQLFVGGASGIATALGVPPYVIGAIIVALGTSMPELVTVVISRLRGHDDVGLGTLLGSNLFNGLAVVGLAAVIHPIPARRADLGVAIAFGLLLVLLLIAPGGTIRRQRGLLLLATYALFIFTTTAAGAAA